MKVNNTLKTVLGLGALAGLYFFLTSASSQKTMRILFVGDSNTDNNYSYADKIKKRYPTIQVDKLAKHGQNTDWMLKNLEEKLKTDKYDVVAVLGGSNDIYGSEFPLEKTRSNLLKMNDLIRGIGAKSVFTAPPSKKFFKDNTVQKLKKLDDLVEWMEKQDFDYFIDFKDMTDKIDLFSSDFRHPNSNAHEILANTFTKTIGIA